ncbi:hypothetical protein NLI96_g13085 [Meripilus lineatus]|uniref:Uncharacterized protein n=1 Tax=Meripilus lineatus TaxID=2056292 RepID=A0AAD5USL6_9APHY|nr:hypothetical protein NLI96_g13085 [Physisporinus lineatus]
MPYGPIQLDEETEKLYLESLRQEAEFKRRKAREDRLRVCEKKWRDFAIKYRELKARTARKKEQDARERRRLDIQAREKRQRDKDLDLADSRPSSSFIPYSYTTTPGTIRPPKPSPGYLYPRPVLSYGSLPGVSNSPPSVPPALAAHQQYQQQYHQRRSGTPPPAFQYSVMSCSRSPPLSSSPSQHSPPNQKKSPLSSPHRALLELSSQSVPFATVVKSMDGPLFPVSEDDEASAICGKANKRRTDQQVQLLEDLLVRGSFGEQTQTQTTPSAPSASRSASTLSVLSSLSPTALGSSSLGSSATVTTRKSTLFSSWMSPFGKGRDAASSRRSVSTVVTSPTSVSLLDPKSVVSSSSSAIPPVASTSASASSSSSTWSSRARARGSVPSPPTAASLSRFRRRIIRVSRPAKVQVVDGEDPLKPSQPLVPFFSNPAPTRTPPSRRHRLIHTLSSHITHYVSSSSKPSTAEEVGFVKKMGRSMSMFMDSYVKATMFTAGDDLYSYSSSRSVYSSFDFSRETVLRVRASIKAPGNGRRTVDGYRVSGEDIVTFLAPPPLHAISILPTPSSARYAPPPSSPAPMSSLPSSGYEPEISKPHDHDDYIVSHPRTRTHPLIQLLPVCLSTSSSCPPRPLVFPAPVLPPRSPFRPDNPPAYLVARFRPVSNPLMLRLRAVMNVCTALGVGVGCESVARVQEEFLYKQRLMQIQQQRELERQMMNESGDDVERGRGRERGRGSSAQRQYAYQELFYHQSLVKKPEIVVQHEHVQRETREKVLGVAYEGIGRSSLGWEVRAW